MLQLYPVYLLCNRRKTRTGSPDPTYMQPANKPCIAGIFERLPIPYWYLSWKISWEVHCSMKSSTWLLVGCVSLTISLNLQRFWITCDLSPVWMGCLMLRCKTNSSSWYSSNFLWYHWVSSLFYTWKLEDTIFQFIDFLGKLCQSVQ